MLRINKEVVAIAQRQPTAERLRALKRIIPCSTIKSILKQTGQTWPCRRLPKRFMVLFVIGMGLYATDCYRQIFRWLERFRKDGTPGRSTLCEARQRLGVAPLRRLFHTVVQLLAVPGTPHAYYRNMRLMSMDGFVCDLPDMPELARLFGRPKGGRTTGAFPQIRILALCETGTHVLWRFLVKPLRCGEVTMAARLLRSLSRDMLLLWDRNFLSYANVVRVLHRQAQLLARIKKHMVFQVVRRFRDGSYLAKLYRASWYRDRDQDGIPVRIIEYTFRDPKRPGSGERHRLLTTLLDPKLDPAKTLILLYHERREEELAIDELKTHQQERPVMRSQTSAGVVQEIYGLLLGHFVVRKLMFEAAKECGVPPRRISFTSTLKILRCRFPQAPSSPQGLRRWYKNLLAEIGEEILEKRRDRVNPRVVRRKMSKWNKKQPKHRNYPQPSKDIQRTIMVFR